MIPIIRYTPLSESRHVGYPSFSPLGDMLSISFRFLGRNVHPYVLIQSIVSLILRYLSLFLEGERVE